MNSKMPSPKKGIQFLQEISLNFLHAAWWISTIQPDIIQAQKNPASNFCILPLENTFPENVEHNWPSSPWFLRARSNQGTKVLSTLPETNVAPDKWWLEDYFPIRKVTFQGRTVKLRGGIYRCLGTSEFCLSPPACEFCTSKFWVPEISWASVFHQPVVTVYDQFGENV